MKTKDGYDKDSQEAGTYITPERDDIDDKTWGPSVERWAPTCLFKLQASLNCFYSFTSRMDVLSTYSNTNFSETCKKSWEVIATDRTRNSATGPESVLSTLFPILHPMRSFDPPFKYVR